MQDSLTTPGHLEKFPFGSCESEENKSPQRFSSCEIGEIWDFLDALWQL
jgi:hypothetical protein